ncbi:MAG: accessory gene regulator B family protein [Eisenbergiella sp.]
MSRLLQRLSEEGYIDEANVEVVAYGLQRIWELLVDVAGTLILGILMDEVIAAVVFEMVYIPLRLYAGGYHASSERRCKYLSWVSIILSITVIHYVSIPEKIQHLFVLITIIIIFLWSPVESANKPLYEMERKVFRYRSIVIVLAESVIYILMFKCGGYVCSKAICIAMGGVGVGVVGGVSLRIFHKTF